MDVGRERNFPPDGGTIWGEFLRGFSSVYMSSNHIQEVSRYESVPAAVERWIDSLDCPGEILILGSTRGAADELARALSLKSHGRVGLHRWTPAQLAAALATPELANAGLAPLSRLGLEALAARASYRSREADTSGYFAPVSGMPGFSRSLASTLLDFRLSHADGDELAQCGGGGPDLALLLELYTQELQSHSLADWATLLELAARALEEDSPWSGLPLVLLDVPPRSRAELRFYRSLIDGSPAMLALVLSGDKPGSETFQTLLGVAAPAATGRRGRGGGTTLSRIRTSLFAAGDVAGGPMDSSFRLFSALGEGHECVEIARSLLEEAKRGTPFDQMAVLLRNPETYQPQMEEALARAGIPGYFSRGISRPDPAGRALLTLLECAEEGLTASRFAEYLSLGQVPRDHPSPERLEQEPPWIGPGEDLEMSFKTGGDAPTAADGDSDPEDDRSPVIAGTLRTPAHWERLLVDASVIGGRDRWEGRLAGLESDLILKQRRREAEGNEAAGQALQDRLERLRNLREFALPVIEYLGDFPHQQNWRAWLERLRRLSALALHRPETVLSLLAELEPMGQVGPVTLTEVREVLSQRLGVLRGDPPERPYGRVFVGTPREACGRSFQVVCLPGLSEGIFPRKAYEDPLLLDLLRRRISTHLPLLADKIQEERRLLRIALAAASRRLLASYPRMDLVRGRSRVPSLYALEIMRGALGQLPDLQELERTSAAASSTRLGWTAPRNPARAIDDAEYDLATLGPVLQAPKSQDTGQGRYLLLVNPWLARSLRARYKRWRPAWSDDDGILARSDPATRRILHKHRLRNRSYSATALEQYATCPYRFFLHSIQRLRPREESMTLERMDPLTRGSLFHEVQFRLFRRLREEDLLPMNAGRLEPILSRADQVLNQVAGSFRERLAPTLPALWESEVEDLRVDLRTWIRSASQEPDGWVPIHFDYAFGLAGGEDRDPESTSEEAAILDGMRLRGIIDLVEMHPSHRVLRITDHKTGKAKDPVPQSVGRGETLQPLLYSLALQELRGLRVVGGRLDYCTQRGNFQVQRIRLDREGRHRIGEVLETIDRAVGEGFLPAAPREESCASCDYRAVCGPYEELRTGLKESRPLEPLRQIRNLP